MVFFSRTDPHGHEEGSTMHNQRWGLKVSWARPNIGITQNHGPCRPHHALPTYNKLITRVWWAPYLQFDYSQTYREAPQSQRNHSTTILLPLFLMTWKNCSPSRPQCMQYNDKIITSTTCIHGNKCSHTYRHTHVY